MGNILVAHRVGDVPYSSVPSPPPLFFFFGVKTASLGRGTQIRACRHGEHVSAGNFLLPLMVGPVQEEIATACAGSTFCRESGIRAGTGRDPFSSFFLFPLFFFFF